METNDSESNKDVISENNISLVAKNKFKPELTYLILVLLGVVILVLNYFFGNNISNPNIEPATKPGYFIAFLFVPGILCLLIGAISALISYIVTKKYFATFHKSTRIAALVILILTSLGFLRDSCKSSLSSHPAPAQIERTKIYTSECFSIEYPVAWQKAPSQNPNYLDQIIFINSTPETSDYIQAFIGIQKNEWGNNFDLAVFADMVRNNAKKYAQGFSNPVFGNIQSKIVDRYETKTFNISYDYNNKTVYELDYIFSNNKYIAAFTISSYTKANQSLPEELIKSFRFK